MHDSIYSFLLVRYSCSLSAGVLHALLCLKVYFLMDPWREMYSMSTYSSAILCFPDFCILKTFCHLLHPILPKFSPQEPRNSLQIILVWLPYVFLFKVKFEFFKEEKCFPVFHKPHHSLVLLHPIHLICSHLPSALSRQFKLPTRVSHWRNRANSEHRANFHLNGEKYREGR